MDVFVAEKKFIERFHGVKPFVQTITLRVNGFPHCPFIVVSHFFSELQRKK